MNLVHVWPVEFIPLKTQVLPAYSFLCFAKKIDAKTAHVAPQVIWEGDPAVPVYGGNTDAPISLHMRALKETMARVKSREHLQSTSTPGIDDVVDDFPGTNMSKNLWGMIQWHVTSGPDQYIRSWLHGKRKGIECVGPVTCTPRIRSQPTTTQTTSTHARRRFVCGAWIPSRKQGLSGHLCCQGTHISADSRRVVSLDTYRLGISSDGLRIVEGRSRTRSNTWAGVLDGHSAMLPTKDKDLATAAFDSFEEYSRKTTRNADADAADFRTLARQSFVLAMAHNNNT